jgi:hypothetical protein
MDTRAKLVVRRQPIDGRLVNGRLAAFLGFRPKGHGTRALICMTEYKALRDIIIDRVRRT